VASAGGNYTFSHNVCGPGIGQGGDPDAHYIQAEGNNNVTIDNNAFEGPANAQTIKRGAHLNVTHQCGNNLKFNKNILWHADAVGQSLLWGDDCQVVGGQANNNLIVEDPRQCREIGTTCNAYSLWIDNAHSSSNVMFSGNTVVNSTAYGGIYARPGVRGFSAHYNLAANDAHNAYSFRGCHSCSHNASGNVRWQNTTWTPNTGFPWKPPPANYYKPGRRRLSAYGYQGTIGP
jgi:hypothetical protein